MGGDTQGKLSTSAEFGIAGTSAVAAITFCQPLDVVKTRLQLQGRGGGARAQEGVAAVLAAVWAREGVRGLERGLSASSLLQFSNVGTRFGGYDYIKRALGITATSGSGCAALWAAGGLSGAMAAVVSNPFYLLKTRLQAADMDPGPQRLTFTGAVRDVYRSGGVLGFYQGLQAFIPRTAAASSVQLASYDTVKAYCRSALGMHDGLPLHAVASFITGIAVVLAMQPFDFAATRLMSQAAGARTSFLATMADAVRTEGILSMYQGTLANYLRFGPYCVLVFVFTEQLRAQYTALTRTAPSSAPAPQRAAV
eukprot:TRINITY_DN16764_c0_g1_i1.p2 TRINITY_DN16764_c0_g1~~TRINITY_DN16764_c0_g1_i1.p2  ORF type:complete len:310 (+),score=108.00 TRINITY_DN16764_c0_g1_i1:103-1032(+)